ncbi:glycosyltransferase family protein [Helcobacillus massiliensis]|uniref:Spore maturation protein CgeB n=1 Tax=Helcobacillus massiliensis TaxID=521392 RepID=A0A839QV40_9MICO|nr:spore maturation protein CgeB [Helcobacillus massiliensis]
MRGARLLILSPAFHDYDRAFSAAFEQLGYQVMVHLYDHNATVAAKARTKLLHELPERLGRDTTEQRTRAITDSAIRALRSVKPQAVLVIKGDVLADDVWSELDAMGIPRALWLYDELRRTRWDRSALAGIPFVASYSAHDTDELREAGMNAHHVPLGFDHLMQVRPAGTRTGEFTFIGARYPNRETVMTRLADAGIPVRVYGRDWSKDPRDVLRTWGSSRPALPWGRDLRRADAYQVMRDGAATLNIHGDQDGFTMRTFEACGVGAVQIIDRADVEGLYEPGRELLVASSADEAVDQAQRIVTDPSWARTIREAGKRRTLAEHTLVHRAEQLAAAFTC